MKCNLPCAVWAAVWAWVGVSLWTCMGVGVEAVQSHSAHYPGGSHAHMKRHQHAQGHTHTHHRPKISLAEATQFRNDPKRPPKEAQPKLQLLHDNELFHDKEHLMEELPEYMDIEKIEAMSDKELDFHYFRMHDFDNNFELDGLELLAALGHVVEEGHEGEEEEGEEEEEEEEGKEGKKKGTPQDDLEGLSDDEKKVVRNYRYEKWEEKWKFFIELVDGVLENNDKNKDGLISWSEFLKGRNKNI